MSYHSEKVRVAEMANPQLGKWGVMVGDHCLYRFPDTPEGKHEAQWQVNIIRDLIEEAELEARWDVNS